MNQLLHSYIDSLREELKQYGELLALLDQQQQLVVLREGTELLESVVAVDAQAVAVQAARQEREQRRSHLARSLELEESSGLKELTGALPTDYQPLVQALVQENQELLVRVRQRARQNHLLLSRSVELMQRLINAFAPAVNTGTYTSNGAARTRASSAHTFYESLG
jgi:flagellar biosynthesis/type III secretory pathway chaperone